jgi:two-component system sensor histidine kinase ChvG
VASLLLSPIARLILASNLAGLIILISGALILNEVRSNLVDARKASLSEMAFIISSFLTSTATIGDPEPRLRDDSARYQLKRMTYPGASRMRVHDASGKIVADTFLLRDEVAGKKLPPIRNPTAWDRFWLDFVKDANRTFDNLSLGQGTRMAEAATLKDEVTLALRGDPAAAERFGDNAERVISVTVPIKLVGAVVGSLTLETSDVARIIAAERVALLPFIIVAVIVALVTSILLTAVIARPLRRLSLASDRVRTGAAERLNLGVLHNRKDEIGDLARAMEAMTATLYDRIQSNERFAADVAHELKNPLTSIRSAVETAQTVQDPAVRDRMQQVIARDVVRLDRLITDISNLSRLEGEIVREAATVVDLSRLLEDLCAIYRDTGRPGDPVVRLQLGAGVDKQAIVMGREGPLGQVVRNLIENARSFSPPGGEVLVSLTRVTEVRGARLRITVDDQGPGVPPDKLEKIFERFYSDRPQGAKFGNNSGLGLSIVKQIVETHRGRVWAENRIEDGRIAGARFNVDLPPATPV